MTRIAVGDDAAPEHQHVAKTAVAQFGHHAREEGEVRAAEERQTHGVDVLLQCGLGDLLRCLVQAGVDDLEPGVAQGAGNHFGATGVAVETRPVAELDALLPGLVHQGVVARVEPAKTMDENQFLASIDVDRHPPLILVLDGVQDPHNLGACLRSADGVGADAVVIPALDSIAWLLNVRGGDVPRTPFALGFALLHRDGHVDVYMDRRKIPDRTVAVGNPARVIRRWEPGAGWVRATPDS